MWIMWSLCPEMVLLFQKEKIVYFVFILESYAYPQKQQREIPPKVTFFICYDSASKSEHLLSKYLGK